MQWWEAGTRLSQTLSEMADMFKRNARHDTKAFRSDLRRKTRRPFEGDPDPAARRKVYQNMEDTMEELEQRHPGTKNAVRMGLSPGPRGPPSSSSSSSETESHQVRPACAKEKTVPTLPVQATPAEATPAATASAETTPAATTSHQAARGRNPPKMADESAAPTENTPAGSTLPTEPAGPTASGPPASGAPSEMGSAAGMSGN